MMQRAVCSSSSSRAAAAASSVVRLGSCSRISTPRIGTAVQQRRPLQVLSTSASRQLSMRQQTPYSSSNKLRKSSLAYFHADKKVPPASVTSLSWHQVRAVLLSAAVPMIGFGFMDNFIMIQAGSMIDNTLGVQFGLATMTAAALGQVVSDTCGVLFGGTLERVLAIRPIQLSAAQQALPLIPRLRLAGAVFGVMLGCSIGAVVGLGLGAPVEQDEHERLKALHHLQQMLEDAMTNPDDKWAASRASCTLYVTGASSTSSSISHWISTATSSNVQSLLSATENNDSLASQCAADAHAITFEGSVYVPVLHSQNKNVVGVLKVKQDDSGSKASLEDAKQLALNLGYIMTHMIE